MYLHLLAAFAQLLFRALELVVRAHEFDRALGHSLLKRRVELTNFAFCPLSLDACSGPAEWHRCRHSVIPGLNPWISLKSPLSISTESAPGCRPCSNG